MWGGLRENETERVSEGEVRAQRGGGLERLQTNEKRIRVCYKLHIYIGRYFSNFVLSLNGSGRVWVRAGFFPKPGPASGFFSKTQTQPYLLSDRVKPDPLGSGQIGHKLPSLEINSLIYTLSFLVIYPSKCHFYKC